MSKSSNATTLSASNVMTTLVLTRRVGSRHDAMVSRRRAVNFPARSNLRREYVHQPLNTGVYVLILEGTTGISLRRMRFVGNWFDAEKGFGTVLIGAVLSRRFKTSEVKRFWYSVQSEVAPLNVNI